MKKILTYLRPIIESNDNKPSIRRILALMFTIGIIRMIEHSYTTNCNIDANVLMVLCGMIAALLALTTWQNITLPTNQEGIVNNADNIK